MPYSDWHKVLQDDRYSASSGMIREYLSLAKGFESPTPYHIWSFISLLGALAGSRIYLDHGAIGKKRLNLGVVLIGFPAIRKSAAIKLMQEFSRGLPLQYGPTDTAGQRQGIMASMLPRWQYDHMEAKEEWDVSSLTLESLADMDTTAIAAALPSPRVPPASELYFASLELGRLLASPSRELLDFFNDALDGNSVHYQLKTQSIRIPNPLINLLGATTPGSLNQLLPRGATDHGFLSRLIFVYADRLTSSSPLPPRWGTPEHHLRESMLARLEHTLDNAGGVLELTEAAERTYTDIYSYRPAINDVRFQAYAGRRAEHLLKIAGILCLSRGAPGQQITASDVRLSHAILTMTEALMPRSFYGLDTRAEGKIQLGVFERLESLWPQEETKDELVKKLSHLGRSMDIQNAISLFESEEKLKHNGSRVAINRQSVDAANKVQIQFMGAAGLDDYAPFQLTEVKKHVAANSQ